MLMFVALSVVVIRKYQHDPDPPRKFATEECTVANLALKFRVPQNTLSDITFVDPSDNFLTSLPTGEDFKDGQTYFLFGDGKFTTSSISL